MNADELLWDPWEVVGGSQQGGIGLDFALLRARGIFFKNLSIAEARWSRCSHFTVSGCLGIASAAVPQELVPSPGLPSVVLLCEEIQGIMQLKNKISTPFLWGYFPTESVSLAAWWCGYGYGVRMRCGFRDDCYWQNLVCCLQRNVAFLLPPSFSKALWLTNPETELSKIKCSWFFLVGLIFI